MFLMLIILFIIFITYLYRSGKLEWIMLKANKHIIIESLDISNPNMQIVKMLIDVLDEYKMKQRINFNNILLTFNDSEKENKITCIIYSWINDMYVKFPCQFIFTCDNGIDVNINKYKIIVNINVWHGKISVKMFDGENVQLN